MKDDKHRYFLKMPDAPWVEVDRRAYIHAERASGFRPKMASDDPRYWDTLATGGFSGATGVQGRSVDMTYYKPGSYAWDPDFPVL